MQSKAIGLWLCFVPYSGSRGTFSFIEKDGHGKSFGFLQIPSRNSCEFVMLATQQEESKFLYWSQRSQTDEDGNKWSWVSSPRNGSCRELVRIQLS